MAISDMRCPNCGASLASVTPSSGVLQCAYCGSHVHFGDANGKPEAEASIPDMQAAFSILEQQVVSLAAQRDEAYATWKERQRAPKGGSSGCFSMLASGLLLLGLAFVASAFGQPSDQKPSVTVTIVTLAIFLLVGGALVAFLVIRDYARRTSLHRQAEQAALTRVRELDTKIEDTKQRAREIRAKLNAAIDRI